MMHANFNFLILFFCSCSLNKTIMEDEHEWFKKLEQSDSLVLDALERRQKISDGCTFLMVY